jgi:hypothetical protein
VQGSAQTLNQDEQLFDSRPRNPDEYKTDEITEGLPCRQEIIAARKA